jgi:spore germination cell wall hydrolase CwlJ-like protein
MKKIMQIIVSIIALTVMAPGHAEEVQDKPMLGFIAQEAQERFDAVVTMLTSPIINFSFTAKDQECLAKNIFYEAASEPEEGKVAVGLVTLNRSRDERFPDSICGVVNQKTIMERVRTVTHQVRTLFGTKQEKEQVVVKTAVCQFSWRCEGNKKIRTNDERWEESQRVARELLEGGYDQYRTKYQNAMYFHATHVKPSWAVQKQKVARIGGHIFYADKTRI